MAESARWLLQHGTVCDLDAGFQTQLQNPVVGRRATNSVGRHTPRFPHRSESLSRDPAPNAGSCLARSARRFSHRATELLPLPQQRTGGRHESIRLLEPARNARGSLTRNFPGVCPRSEIENSKSSDAWLSELRRSDAPRPDEILPNVC